MILQGVYRFAANQAGPDVVMEEVENPHRVVVLTLNDWHEMGRPEQVSVTVMKLLVRM